MEMHHHAVHYDSLLQSSHFSSLIVMLKKGREDERIAKIFDSPCLPENDCVFKIADGGIQDPWWYPHNLWRAGSAHSYSLVRFPPYIIFALVCSHVCGGLEVTSLYTVWKSWDVRSTFSTAVYWEQSWGISLLVCEFPLLFYSGLSYL